MGYIYRPMVRGGTLPPTADGAKAKCADQRHGKADQCPGCGAQFARRWWVQYYQNGRAIRESTGTEKETEARKVLKLKEGRAVTGQAILPRVDRITYDELAGDLVRHYQTTGKRNLIEVGWRLGHLKRFFAGRRALAIGPAEVTAYVAKRQNEHAANGNINRELAVLKRMFRLAWENEKVFRVPVIRRLKEAPPRSGFFEREQFEAVRKHLPPDLQVAVSIAYTFGWRIYDEVLSLERRQVDLETGTLRLDPGQTKNADGRLVYLTPELRALLAAQEARVMNLMREGSTLIPYLFPHLAGRFKGKPRRRFVKAWETACERAGCVGLLKHDFRRTAVRNMVNAGIPERVAMTMTGHKTRSVFDRYHIVSPADLREATRKLADTTADTTRQTALDANAATMRHFSP